jgi:NAD(P)-dependent dehydrogenase (short-subunit alcohol dehydrogenase family)
MRFAGKTVVVTGSGRDKGLGQAILQRFADEGANCVVSDITITSEGEGIAERLRYSGATVAAIACDVGKVDQCQALISRTLETFGGIDVLVNNAGIGFMMKPFLEVNPADWDRVVGVNLSGAFYCTQAAAKAMREAKKGGRIINIASQAAKSGFPHMASYCASKHGMIGLTRSNAVELGQYGITVNAICPNHVTTGLGSEQNEYFSKLLGFDSVAAYLENMARMNPMGRAGLATDTAATCAWLASDDACYITGEAINVSGGEEMH